MMSHRARWYRAPVEHTRRFIAQMKVRALAAQRDELADAYERLLHEAQASSGTARVKLLYETLSGLSVAGERVHGELPDLRALLEVGLDDALAQVWEARLVAEIDRGRVRSEAVYVFGALLEETASGAVAPATAAVEMATLDRAWTALTRPAGGAPSGLASFLDDLSGPGGLFERLRAAIARDLIEEEPSAASLVAAGLPFAAVVADREHAPLLRREAQQFEKDDEAQVALRDAMAMLLETPSSWRWTGPMQLRAVHPSGRIRVRLDVDLVSLLSLELISSLLRSPLSSVLRTAHANRRSRLARLLELDAPEIILQSERQALSAELGVLDDERVLLSTVSSGSVVVRREQQRFSLFEAGLENQGPYGYGSTRTLALWVQGEVALWRASQAAGGLYVLKTDVADCFPSLDHGVMLAVLARAGLPAAWRQMVEGFLRSPARHRGAELATTHGVPLGFSLSRLLANLILSGVELRVKRHCAVSLARVVDDVVMVATSPGELAAAWATFQEALAAVGLSVQSAKTGAVALGGALPEALPVALPSWNLLHLTPDGWAIDREALAAWTAEARRARDGARSALDAVKRYNDDLRFLIDALLSDVELVDGHVARARAAVLEFHDRELAIEEFLRARIEARCSPRRSLPRGWLYWPVSAGGLGLLDPRLLMGSRPVRRQAPLPTEPFDELSSDAWGSWYHAWFEQPAPVEPASSAVSKALVDDFIARGGEIQGAAQAGLSAYWRWVLTTHGADITDAFGTFRFLNRRLVPLELVRGDVG
jgi:hypothetical protein